MTNYLLDSDIVIDFLNRKNFAINFFAKASKNNIFLSVISWLEIVYGFKKSKSKNKITLFQDLLHDLQIKTLSVDIRVAQEYLDCKTDLEDKRIPLADFDLLIAATAIVNDFKLVTRNTNHFKRINKLKLFK